jgi:hypothetical protein
VTIQPANADDVLEAKQAYEKWCSAPNKNLGPVWQFPEGVDTKRLVGLCDKFLRFAQSHQGGRVVNFPSPWHVWFFCIRAQHACQKFDAHLLFRGQNNSSFPLVSSIERLPVAEQLLNKRAQEILYTYLATELSSCWHDMEINFSTAISTALAQHYGIKTQLLDFTPDPAVAIYFAARRPQKIKCPTATVYGMRLEEAYKQGARVIIPPPFVHRLHLQRGVFVDMAGRSGPMAEELISEFRFPVDYPHGPFEVIRDGKKIDLLMPDMWIERLVAWASLRANNPAGCSPAELQALTARIPIPQYLVNPFETMAQMAGYVDSFTELLYWLVYIIRGDKEVLFEHLLKPFTTANPDITLHAATIMEAWGKQINNPSKVKLANVLRKTLSKD